MTSILKTVVSDIQKLIKDNDELRMENERLRTEILKLKDNTTKSAAVLAREERRKRVLSLYLANPSLRSSEIARHFNISAATVNKYLAESRKDG